MARHVEFDTQGNVVSDEGDPEPATATVLDRLAAVEEKLDAVAQLADEANATAQDVAQRVRDSGKP